MRLQVAFLISLVLNTNVQFAQQPAAPQPAAPKPTPPKPQAPVSLTGGPSAQSPAPASPATPAPATPAPTPVAPVPQQPATNTPANAAPQAQPAAPQTTTPQSTAPQAAGSAGNLVLNLPGASLTEVIDTLARVLKINYILDPRVKGNVTIHTYGEIRSTDVRGLLDTILRINGFAMIQVGDIFRIVPTGEVARLPMKPQTNAESRDLPDEEGMILNLVFLKYATAGEMKNILTPFIGEGGNLSVYEPANLLLLLDNGRNMKRTMDLVSLFDSDTLANQRIRLYELSNGRPTDLARELETIFKGLSLGSKSGGVQFLPVDRLNTLIAVAPNPGIFPEVEKWVEKLDIPVKAPVGGVDNFVYRVKYGRADSMALAVTMLYASQQDNPIAMMTTLSMMMMFIGLTAQLSQFTNNPQGGNGGGGGMGGGAGTGQFGQGGFGMGGMGMGGFGMGGMFPGMFGMGGMGMGGFGMGGMGMGGMGMGGMFPGMGGTQPNLGAFGGSTAAGTPGTGRPGDATGTYVGQQAASPIASTRVPKIIPNPFDNTLLIQSTQQEYEQISRLLNKLDIAPRQVLIEARIYEISLTGAFSAGVQAFLQRRGTTTGGNLGGGSGSAAQRILLGQSTGAGLNLTAGLLVGQSRELLGFLSTQEDQRRVRVINAPQIIATDNIAASINVGQQVPTLASQAVSSIQQAGTSLFTNQVSSRSAGVNLNITARVLASGIVTLIINQEVSSPVPPAASSSIQSPSFSQRNVNTQVTLQDGDTIAIGGIITESDTFSTSGIPGLHKIPVVGNVFGSRAKSRERTELVIFMTPRVIYDTPEISEASDEIRGRFKRLNKLMKDQ
jgi:general secretion pathway protein D